MAGTQSTAVPLITRQEKAPLGFTSNDSKNKTKQKNTLPDLYASHCLSGPPSWAPASHIWAFDGSVRTKLCPQCQRLNKKTKGGSRFCLLLFLSNRKEGRKAREHGWTEGRLMKMLLNSRSIRHCWLAVVRLAGEHD